MEDKDKAYLVLALNLWEVQLEEFRKRSTLTHNASIYYQIALGCIGDAQVALTRDNGKEAHKSIAQLSAQMRSVIFEMQPGCLSPIEARHLESISNAISLFAMDKSIFI